MDLSFRTECLNTIMDFPDKQDCIEIYYLSFNNKLLKIMCEYAEIENIKLSILTAWRKRSIPTHLERHNPPTIIAKMGLKRA